MPYVIPRETRPAIAYTAALTATTTFGGILLVWYIHEHATPKWLLMGGILLTGMTIATICVVRRQRRILDRLDAIDRQFAKSRITYVAENIDPDVIDLDQRRREN